MGMTKNTNFEPYQHVKIENEKRTSKDTTPKKQKRRSSTKSPQKQFPVPSGQTYRNKENYDEEYYAEVKKFESPYLLIGIKALVCTKMIILLYAIISCMRLQVRDCYSCEDKNAMILNLNLSELWTIFYSSSFSVMPCFLYPIFFVYFLI